MGLRVSVAGIADQYVCVCVFGGRSGGEEYHRHGGLQILPMRMPMLAAATAAKYSTKKVVTAPTA
jgi:hypothetical protein